MEEIIPGIFRIKVPMPNPEAFMGYNNAYLVRDDRGTLLLDPGFNNDRAFQHLEKSLGEIGVSFRDITHIFVSHVHSDHYGLVLRLKKLSGARLYLHRLEKDLITARFVETEMLLKQTIEAFGINGVPPAELPELEDVVYNRSKRYMSKPVFPDVMLEGGEEICTGRFTFRVVWSPGHSPGQICLYEPAQKLLLSGDHILPNITPNIGLYPESGANPIGDFIGSLKEIQELDVDLILPGHEDPFRGLKERIDFLMRHHDKRNRNIIDALQPEAGTAYQVAARIPWLTNEGGCAWTALSAIDKRLAMFETLAHLEFLCSRGILEKFRNNGSVYFRLS
ncbi:MAG: MBL fold metallo-hydrolase [Chloroflexi bacterium]|nr:MBL fold metallo-hydrolase [Chloroflexota bacterium]